MHEFKILNKNWELVSVPTPDTNGYVAVEDVPGAVYLGTQSEAFETWIWPLVMLTPALAALLYIIPLLFIKYTPEQKAQVERELAERRAFAENETPAVAE